MATAIEKAEPTQIVPRATTEQKFVDQWLQANDSPHTRRSYARTVTEFLSYVGKPITEVTRADLQDYKNELADSDLKPATVNQRLAAIKSMLSDLHRSGYLRVNVGAAVKLLKSPDRLGERILDQVDMMRIISLEQNPRNHALLTLLYYSGGRVSEVCALKWKNLVGREKGGQVTLFGKGGRTRTVKLNARVWKLLQALRDDGDDAEGPVFASQRGGHLHAAQVWRVVRAAAERASIKGNMSPHWFRHGHASHALDAGCPVHVVKDTLGHSSLTTTSRYAHARPTESSSDYLK